MRSKLIALFLLVLCFGGLSFMQNGVSNISEINTSDLDSFGSGSTKDVSNYEKITELNTSKVNWGTTVTLGVNTQTDVSGVVIDNTSVLYPTFKFDLIAGYYLNLSLLGANWKYSTNIGGSITNYIVDIDYSVFFSNQTLWFNASSNNDNEIYSSQIPETDTYFIALYPFENNVWYFGSLLSKQLLDTQGHTNSTYYGGNVTAKIDPHANAIRLQMMDEGGFTYGNSLDIKTATEIDILSHMPTLHPGVSTWLWEHNKFGLPSKDLYKIFVPANTSIDITIQYGAGAVTTSLVDKYEDVGSITNYNRYLDFLHGTPSGVYNQTGTNDAGGVGAPEIYYTYINYKTPVDSDSYYILAINNTKLDVTTFEYNITIKITDYIDSSSPNNDYSRAYKTANLLNFTLFTNVNDPDFFILKPSSQPLRLTVNIYFDRNYGVINLYVFNRSLATYPTDDSKSLVGKSTFTNQNQQTVTYNIFDLNDVYIKVNSSAPYSNAYTLNITLGPIDDQFEPNNDFFHPATLYNPTTYKLFMAQDDLDFFRIFLFKTDLLNVTIYFDGTQADLNLLMYDEALNPLGSSYQASSNNESVVITASQNGYYYFTVFGLTASFLKPGIDYNLTIKIVEKDDYLEPNDNKDQTAPIQDGIYQLISRAGDEDWFNIYMRANDILTVSVTFDTSKGDIDIFLYDLQAQTQLADSQSFTANESLTFTASLENQYLLRIALFDGLSVNYNLNITLTDEVYDPYEDNDNFQQAYNITDGFYSGIIAQGGDYDFFKVKVPTGYAIIVELLEETPNTGKDFSLVLYNSKEVEINRSERDLNTQYIKPVPVTSTTTFFIDAHFKGYGKVTYSLNITFGLNSALFPPAVLPTPTNIPTFSFNTFTFSTGTSSSSSTSSKAGLYDIGSMMAIGIVGIAGGAAAGVGGTVIAQKTKFGGKSGKKSFKR